MARTLYHMTRTKFVGDGPRGSGLSRRSRVLLQAASLFWWVEEWACAVGNTFEDFAVVAQRDRRTPAEHRRRRRAGEYG
jgi:hypothetical protein